MSQVLLFWLKIEHHHNNNNNKKREMLLVMKQSMNWLQQISLLYFKAIV